MKYKLVIFDLDGTILNTLEDLTDSMNAALLKFGYPTRTIEEIRKFVGDGLLMLARRAAPQNLDEEKILALSAAQRVYYKEHCADKTKPYEGIVELLKELKTAGYQLAVVSNKADEAVRMLCEQYFFDIFDMTVGEKEHVRRKPAPDSVNAVLEAMHRNKMEAVYVGDSEVDIQTAENAGLDAILVSWGFREAEFLKECGAKNIVKTVEMLKNALTKQNSLL